VDTLRRFGVVKSWFFKNYWWFIGIVAAVSIVLITRNEQWSQWHLTLGIMGTALSGIYFVQRQRLEEIHFFREIFDNFNKRYDCMNEKLNDIIRKDDSSSLSVEEKDTLNDYFNLCGEEYLYFREGYLLPNVWHAWKNGIRIFLKCKRINDYWKIEMSSGSYYGLEVKLDEAPSKRRN